MKQSGLALMLYAGDYNDRLPASSEWMEASKPYSAGGKYYHCPLVKDGHGFAMNDALSRKLQSKIANPNSVIMLFETADESYNAHGKPPERGAELAPRHGSRSLAYADGSTKSWRDPRK